MKAWCHAAALAAATAHQARCLAGCAGVGLGGMPCNKPCSDWQQAQSQLQAAQGQLGEAQADQTDLDTHRRTYEVLKTSGLLGGEPRAIWVEDLREFLPAWACRPCQLHPG